MAAQRPCLRQPVPAVPARWRLQGGALGSTRRSRTLPLQRSTAQHSTWEHSCLIDSAVCAGPASLLHSTIQWPSERLAQHGTNVRAGRTDRLGYTARHSTAQPGQSLPLRLHSSVQRSVLPSKAKAAKASCSAPPRGTDTMDWARRAPDLMEGWGVPRGAPWLRKLPPPLSSRAVPQRQRDLACLCAGAAPLTSQRQWPVSSEPHPPGIRDGAHSLALQQGRDVPTQSKRAATNSSRATSIRRPLPHLWCSRAWPRRDGACLGVPPTARRSSARVWRRRRTHRG